MGPEVLAIARGDTRPDEAQREGAVHCPGGHERVAQALGEETSGGALARPGRAVDRDHRLVSHASSTTIASVLASALTIAANCGNDVATHAVSSTIVSPSATSPATASA